MTRKILINKEYGGFGLSDAAIEAYLIKSNIPYEKKERQVASLLLDKMFFFTVNGENFTDRDIPRDDLNLIKIAEEMGLENIASKFCELKIVEIPADVQWQIMEYDGLEWVAEKHRIWE